MADRALRCGGFELTQEQSRIQELARKFADTHVRPVAAGIDKRDSIPRALWEKFARPPYRFVGACIPEEYGGRGLGMFEISLIMEELGYVSLAFATIVEVSTIAPLVILKGGNRRQKEKYLRPLAEGELWLGIMITDEGAGSDAAGMKTVADEVTDGYVLNGKKRLISMAEEADAFVVFAKTAPEQERRSISAFVVDKDSPGLRVIRRQKCQGMHGHRTWEYHFVDCKVPSESLIGERGQGMRYLLMTLDDSRATLAAGHLGLARAAFDLALSYAKQRVAFGQPISENQGISFPLVELATEIEAARYLAYRAAWLADQGVWHKKETGMAKYYAAELAVKASLLAVSVLGGIGVTDEYPAERYLRDAVTFRFAQGTPEIQKLIVARELFKD